MVKFCTFICFKPILQFGKCIVKAILKMVSFRTNNIGQYSLGLQIDSLDRNRLRTTQETRHHNREWSAE
jgi:hypothetical protein